MYLGRTKYIVKKNISDKKKIMGPTTLYSGKKLAPTMSIRDPWAAVLRASPHSPLYLRPL